jgi:predicted Ser/Thr protein kinase
MGETTIYEEYKKENQEWDLFINRILGPQAQLISVSPHTENRRIYHMGEKIAKVRKVVKETSVRAQDLAGEYKLLSRLNDIEGVCKNPQFFQEDGWELLSYEYTPGTSLENILNEKSLLKKEILWKILRVIISVNRHGIAHRDIKPENIIVSENGKEVSLVDFDQAQEMPPYRAVLVDILGVGAPEHLTNFNFRWLLGKTLVSWSFCQELVSIPFQIVRRLVRKESIPRKSPMFEYCATDNPDIKTLQEAWEIGRSSPANAPGLNLVYYSLDVAGCHFPGERSWILRWHEISRKVDFRGKRVLELGCNLGLFSAFARHKGARECVGVDHDSAILDGARLVSKAFHVNNEFYQVDFDADELWEEKFRGFDLVIALSVVNWLTNRERFLAFLGKYHEVLYEGHESLNIEFGRLRRAGFDRIEIIMVSERNRAIFLAAKS